MQFAELFESHTWEFAHIAIRRAAKDRRSRKFLGELIGKAVLIPTVMAGVTALVTAVVYVPETLTMLAVFLGLGIGATLRQLRTQAKRQAAIDAAADAVPVESRTRIFRTTYWLANLIRRNDSEVYIQTKEMPPGIEVIARRLLLDRLESHEIWDEMPEGVRELVLKPDGHWSPLDLNRVGSQFELLACLRWATRKDQYLRPLSLPPRYDYKQTTEIIEDSDWFGPHLTVAPEQLERLGQNTMRFVNRCWIEAVARGLIEVDGENLAMALKAKEEADPGSDWLFGSRSIGELTDDELRSVYHRASFRWQASRSLAEEMSSGTPEGGLRRLLDGVFPTQVQEQEQHSLE